MKTAFMRWSALRARPALIALMLAATVSTAAAETTYSRTIKDTNRDNLLEFAPGEYYVVRKDLRASEPGRSGRRQVRLSFAQFTDTRMWSTRNRR